MNTKKLGIFTLLSLFLGVPTASAASISILNGPMQTLSTAMHNYYIVYGLTLIFFFMLLYGIYASALKFVPVFKGGDNLTHQGKIVGLSLSALTTLSVFYFTKGSPQTILASVLDPFGIFGGLTLAALFGGLTYYGIRSNDNNSRSLAWAATAAGFGMIIAGLITTQDSIMMWGFLIALIAGLFALFSSGFGVGRADAAVAGAHGAPAGGGAGAGAANAPRQVENFRGIMREP